MDGNILVCGYQTHDQQQEVKQSVIWTTCESVIWCNILYISRISIYKNAQAIMPFYKDTYCKVSTVQVFSLITHCTRLWETPSHCWWMTLTDSFGGCLQIVYGWYITVRGAAFCMAKSAKSGENNAALCLPELRISRVREPKVSHHTCLGRLIGASVAELAIFKWIVI